MLSLHMCIFYLQFLHVSGLLLHPSSEGILILSFFFLSCDATLIVWQMKIIQFTLFTTNVSSLTLHLRVQTLCVITGIWGCMHVCAISLKFLICSCPPNFLQSFCIRHHYFNSLGLSGFPLQYTSSIGSTVLSSTVTTLHLSIFVTFSDVETSCTPSFSFTLLCCVPHSLTCLTPECLWYEFPHSVVHVSHLH